MSDRPYWCEICARKKECYGITLKPKCFVPTADRKTEPTISKMEQVDEPKTQMKTQNSNLTFEKADEPQTKYKKWEVKPNADIPTEVTTCVQVPAWMLEDEQTDCPWK